MPTFQLPIRSHCLISAWDIAPALCPSSVFPPQLIISMQPYCYFYLLLILQVPLHFTPPFYNKTQRKRCLFLLPPIFSPPKGAGLIRAHSSQAWLRHSNDLSLLEAKRDFPAANATVSSQPPFPLIRQQHLTPAIFFTTLKNSLV